MTPGRPVVILGAGGHARVLIAALRLAGHDIRGVTSPKLPSDDPGVPWLGSDDILDQMIDTVLLANGLGSIGDTSARSRIFRGMKARGFNFTSVVHPAAIVDQGASLGEGVQLLAGAVVQTGAILERNVLINTGAIVDHDCWIGANCHIAPGCCLSGGVIVEDEVHVGTGATVIQGCRVGRGAVIAAGAVVIGDVPPRAIVAGVPARHLRFKE